MSQTDPPQFEDEKQAHTTLQETRTQLLEREVQLRQLKYQLRETAAKAQLYQERYLWAKVALETVEKGIESPTDTESLLGKNSSIDGNSNLQSQDRKIEEMSILLIEKDAELKQAQDIAKKLAKQLKQMRQLTAQRIQELEKEIARSHSGDE